MKCEIATRFLAVILIGSLIFLKQGKNDAAAANYLIAYHVALFLTCLVGEGSMGVLIAVNLTPGIGFLITSSSVIHTLNIVLSCLQISTSIAKTEEVFSGSNTEEQQNQIITMQMIACCTFATHVAHNYLTKYIEKELLNHAKIHSERVTDITKELVQVLSAKDDLVSRLSHEIQEHLSSLNNTIDNLFLASKDIVNKETLRNAKLSSEKLLNLIRNILDTIKLKPKKTEFRIDPVDALKTVFTAHKEALRKNHNSVKAFILNDVPTLICIDAGRFIQILTNIMSNAVKFTKKNGKIKVYVKRYAAKASAEVLKERIEIDPFGTISQNKEKFLTEVTPINCPTQKRSSEDANILEDLSLELDSTEVRSHHTKFKYLKAKDTKTLNQLTQNLENFLPWEIVRENNASGLDFRSQNSNLKKGYLKIQISDNGCGISKSMLHQLVSMLTEKSYTRFDENGDTGFGLWISKHLCEELGGGIAIHSEKNNTTSVVFYVTVNNISGIENSEDLSNLSKKMHVLVVDDDVFVRNLHKFILEQEGAQVILASDGTEAVEEYEKHQEGHFDLIMTDIQMSKMNGFTAIKKIREFEDENEWKPVEICLISGEYYDEGEMFIRLKASIRPFEVSKMKYLRKPVDIAAMKKIVYEYQRRQEDKKRC